MTQLGKCIYFSAGKSDFISKECEYCQLFKLKRIELNNFEFVAPIFANKESVEQSTLTFEALTPTAVTLSSVLYFKTLGTLFFPA